MFRLLDFNAYNDKSRFVVEMYGIAKDGSTGCIIISDFCPFFFVLGSDDWSENSVPHFINHILRATGKKNEGQITGSFHNCKKLYGFSGGNSSKFIKLEFKNM